MHMSMDDTSYANAQKHVSISQDFHFQCIRIDNSNMTLLRLFWSFLCQLSNEKKPGWLYRGWLPTQLYWDYNKPL